MKKLSYFLIVLFLFNLVAQPAAVSAQVNIPSGATITSAELSMYAYTTGLKTVNAHRITSSWNEDTVTWNSFSDAFDPAVIDSFTPIGAGWQILDVRSTVQGWVDGTIPNYGFLLVETPPAVSEGEITRYHSSEYGTVDLRPKLDVCYTAPSVSETCITIQRSSNEQGDVFDTYIRSDQANANFASSIKLYTNLRTNYIRHTLIRFVFTTENPDVDIIKYTNGQLANDPDGVDVPQIVPGQEVVWTYRVSNTGNVAVARADVVVTDDQPGVTPVYDSELTGNGDDVFDPSEVWWFKAVGVAVALDAPPGGVMTYPGYCTNGGTEAPRTAYINQGTVSIPGADATAQSSYCNPSDEFVQYFYYLPLLDRQRSSLINTPFRVTVGYEDLPLAGQSNDWDYNDWIVDIEGTGTFESMTSDRWSSMSFTFSPNGRGAAFKHAFHMLIPPGTFSSNGTYTLTTFGPTGAVVSTVNGVFNATGPADFTIFPDTGVVYPASLTNTLEDRPRVTAQRTAELVINFDNPIDFFFSDYDYTAAHGTGLFFDPYLVVLGSNDVVHRGDLRLLNVPERMSDTGPTLQYDWPEEWMRIDRVYTNLTFIPANPPTRPTPDIIFPDGWWLTHNNCVIDGIVCPIPARPVNPLDFQYYNP